VAITTLFNFLLPDDTAASSRYWEHDIINPEVTVENGGDHGTGSDLGIGYEPAQIVTRIHALQQKICSCLGEIGSRYKY
jgi:O-succinylbenzoate synthase